MPAAATTPTMTAVYLLKRTMISEEKVGSSFPFLNLADFPFKNFFVNQIREINIYGSFLRVPIVIGRGEVNARYPQIAAVAKILHLF